jgi:hypothetical protein
VQDCIICTVFTTCVAQLYIFSLTIHHMPRMLHGIESRTVAEFATIVRALYPSFYLMSHLLSLYL